MKRFLLLLIALLCFNTAQAGVIINDYVAPALVTDMQIDNINHLECGEAQILHILGLFDIGAAGIQDAAKNGKISRIHHVDIRKKTFLGIGKTTIRVYGL